MTDPTPQTTTPTRDEAVQSPLDIAMDALFDVRRAIFNADPAVLTDTLWMPEDTYKGGTVVDFIENAMERVRSLASAPAPASGGVDAVGVCGISADTESKRVLKLHFKHEVTDADRKTIIDAFNTLNRERRSALSPAATPVSEAEPVGRGDLIDGLDDLARRMPASADKLLLSEAIGLIQSLAKPASSPAPVPQPYGRRSSS